MQKQCRTAPISDLSCSGSESRELILAKWVAGVESSKPSFPNGSVGGPKRPTAATRIRSHQGETRQSGPESDPLFRPDAGKSPAFSESSQPSFPRTRESSDRHRGMNDVTAKDTKSAKRDFDNVTIASRSNSRMSRQPLNSPSSPFALFLRFVVNKSSRLHAGSG